MKKVLITLSLLLLTFCAMAQSENPSELRQYIQAFESSVAKGDWQAGIDNGTKAAAQYAKLSLYKESFDYLRHIDQTIDAKAPASERAALHYWVTKERYNMYVKFRKPERIKEQLAILEALAGRSNNENVGNDILYTKTLYYYSTGQADKGNQTFKEMATKLTAQKEYGKVDEVYKKLIANGQRSGSATLVAQSYKSYLAWKDSTTALQYADQINGLKKQIADNEAEIADKDSSLTARMATIIALGILAVALAAALVVGALVLMRFILLTRKQKSIIKLESDNNALKAKFISNISSQLDPALAKLDNKIPEVKALQGFSEHIQQLSVLECSKDEAIETEDISVATFCEELINQVRGTEQSDVTLAANAPKMSVPLNREYVTHILLHLLRNAVLHTPAGGRITLDYKKRGAHTHQFIVTDTGCGISEEPREEVFKAFRQIRDLTQGDGLGLPICKQMALKMKGDLTIDPEYHKGTRFVLELHG